MILLYVYQSDLTKKIIYSLQVRIEIINRDFERLYTLNYIIGSCEDRSSNLDACSCKTTKSDVKNHACSATLSTRLILSRTPSGFASCLACQCEKISHS